MCICNNMADNYLDLECESCGNENLDDFKRYPAEKTKPNGLHYKFECNDCPSERKYPIHESKVED